MRIILLTLFSILIFGSQSLLLAENENLPPERLELRQKTPVTKLKIKILSTNMAVLKLSMNELYIIGMKVVLIVDFKYMKTVLVFFFMMKFMVKNGILEILKV